MSAEIAGNFETRRRTDAVRAPQDEMTISAQNARGMRQIASRLVNSAGNEAPALASQWGSDLLKTGDREGCANWTAVVRLCEGLLQRKER